MEGKKWTEKSIAQKICLHFRARVIPLPTKKMGMEGLCLETMEKDNNAQTLPMPSLPNKITFLHKISKMIPWMMPWMLNLQGVWSRGVQRLLLGQDSVGFACVKRRVHNGSAIVHRF